MTDDIRLGSATSETDNSTELFDAAIALVAPLLNLTATATKLTKSADPAAEEKAAAAAASIFDAIDVSKEYVRPNGETYSPRSMSVNGVAINDVTLVRSAVAENLPVLLYGPPGTGKTALLEAALPNVITVQGTIETEAADFLGSYVQATDGTYHWIDGPGVVAAEEGRPLFIDEIALIDPRSLAVIYGAMDGRGEFVVTQNPARGVVKVKPGFIVIGAFNPDVPGAVTSDALMSRFPIQVEMKTDWSLASRLGVSAKIVQVTRNLQRKYEEGAISASPQLRELLAYRNLEARYGADFALANYFGQIRPENRSVALEVIKSVMGSEPKILSL